MTESSEAAPPRSPDADALRFSTEQRGSGWTIYDGRQPMRRHGLNIGTMDSEFDAKALVELLNDLASRAGEPSTDQRIAALEGELELTRLALANATPPAYIATSTTASAEPAAVEAPATEPSWDDPQRDILGRIRPTPARGVPDAEPLCARCGFKREDHGPLHHRCVQYISPASIATETSGIAANSALREIAATVDVPNGTHVQIVEGVKGLRQSFNNICERMRACATRHQLGLGGEHLDELIVAEIDRLHAAASERPGGPVTGFEAEMAKQASLGHKQFCVGVHPATDEWPEQAEWIEWPKAFALLASRSSGVEASEDTKRLDWWEMWGKKGKRALVGHNWSLSIQTDDKAHAQMRKGEPTFRAAIDAARRSQGEG